MRPMPFKLKYCNSTLQSQSEAGVPEMGSGRVQPEIDGRLAQGFVTSDRSRQELAETRP
jgi:hypothetical protein